LDWKTKDREHRLDKELLGDSSVKKMKMMMKKKKMMMKMMKQQMIELELLLLHHHTQSPREKGYREDEELCGTSRLLLP